MNKQEIHRALIEFFDDEDCEVDDDKISVSNGSASTALGDLTGAGMNEVSLSKLAQKLHDLQIL